jgi:hypothetical protein
MITRYFPSDRGGLLPLAPDQLPGCGYIGYRHYAELLVENKRLHDELIMAIAFIALILEYPRDD